MLFFCYIAALQIRLTYFVSVHHRTFARDRNLFYDQFPFVQVISVIRISQYQCELVIKLFLASSLLSGYFFPRTRSISMEALTTAAHLIGLVFGYHVRPNGGMALIRTNRIWEAIVLVWYEIVRLCKVQDR